jgi:hypothetical protein
VPAKWTRSRRAKPEDVCVSIVPFSKDVNFDPANYNENWIRWDLWEAVNGTCSDPSYNKQSSCVSKGKILHLERLHHRPRPNRDNERRRLSGRLVSGEQYSWCSVPLMGLSNDWTALSAKIDSMTPVGNTNQAIGLQAGWQTGLANLDRRTLHRSPDRSRL